MGVSNYCEFVDEQRGDKESPVRQVVLVTCIAILKVYPQIVSITDAPERITGLESMRIIKSSKYYIS